MSSDQHILYIFMVDKENMYPFSSFWRLNNGPFGEHPNLDF